MPFVGIISFLGFIGSLFALIPYIGEPICRFFDMITDPFVTLLLWISEVFSHLPGSLHYVVTPSITAILIFYTVLLGITISAKLNFSKKYLNMFLIILFIIFLGLIFKDSFSKELKFEFFSVGEADSALVQTPDHHYFLVDTGNFSKKGFNTAKSVINSYMKKNGINYLDFILLTHPDSDHIGGTVDILKNFDVGKVLDNGDTSKSKTYRILTAYIKKNKILDEHLSDGEKINFDKNLDITVIKPDHVKMKTNNDDSVILYLKYRDFTALMMADNEAQSLKSVQKYVKYHVNIIKIGHHGSKKSVNEAFIRYLRPK